MSEIEDIAFNQTRITEEVHRLWTNFKKDGESRYSVEYFVRRLEQLEEHWTNFQINNGYLEDLRKTNPQHEYFVRKYFSQFETRYLDIKGTFKAKLEVIRKNTQPAPVQLPSVAGIQASRLSPVNRSPNRCEVSQESTSDTERTNIKKCPAKFKKLNVIKNNFTRIIEKLELTQNAVYLAFKLDQIREYWTKLVTMNDEIMSSLEEADYDQEYVSNNEFVELEQLYQDAYIQIKEAEQRQHQPEAVTPQTATHREIKLPPISIPSFSGKYEEWTSFWELFDRLVHQNGTLSDVERIQYLKGNLKGEAARIVNHLAPTSSNYATAIELLTNRFQNSAALVNNYIQKLLTLKSVRHENAFDLKTIMDMSREILYGIKNLGVDVSSWDPLVIQLLCPKLDSESRKLYQQSRGTSTEIPKLSEFFDFIEARFRGLESSREFNREHQQVRVTATKNHLTTVTESKCVVCSESHQLYNCKRFLNMKTKNRLEVVQRSKLCFNCLRDGHTARECAMKRGCKICAQQHNSLLHFPRGESTVVSGKERISSEEASTSTRIATACHSNRTVLLATAMVNICVGGEVRLARALIDQGSQSCFVTAKLARQLKVPLVKYESKINGINGHATEIIAACRFIIQSIHDEKVNLEVDALVMPVITSRLPAQQVTPNQWLHIQGLKLADPWYEQPKEIELLIGSDILPQFLTHGLVKGPANTPMAQNTRFGWILSGPVSTILTSRKKAQVNILTSCISLCSKDEDLKKFWELEEVPSAKIKSTEDEMCENHYQMTHNRDETGRYIVKLPLLKDRMVLGDSRKMALKRFFVLEQRFAKNESLRDEYSNFIREYINLGHMEEVSNGYTGKRYYLPHHAVIKEDSTTTKLRVVFDASAKTTSGESLNSIMMTGPTVQKDLFSLLLRWRTFPIVFTADIEKMYRQILVDQEDRNLQRILWRENSSDPIKEYVLKTVTYGTSSAPYLAIKTLCQLAEDEKQKYPRASQTLLDGFYVDDCLGGANSLTECQDLQKELMQLLRNGGFNLRKWTSNNAAFIKALPTEAIDMEPEHDFNSDTTFKILGIKWCPGTDDFQFKVNFSSFSTKGTKRAILSDAGKIFDPFGWLSPITIKAKIIIQRLWLLGIGWDENVPMKIQKEWNEFKTRLSTLEKVRIPRWTQQMEGSQIELHGFADASESAYAAVVYQKVINRDSTTISLIASKTKVAPVKQVSLARLELCAATLLTKLMKCIREQKDTNYTKVLAWSDSTIVLNWLKQHPVKWNTFVANRVSYVQQHFKGQWKFVPGRENPADIPSRGSFGDALAENSTWWHGPEWLKEDQKYWPADKSMMEMQDMPEIRKYHACLSMHPCNPSHKDDIYLNFSSFSKLQRVSAYCLRFKANCQRSKRHVPLQYGRLTVRELLEAERALVRGAQRSFSEDMKSLNANKSLKSNSKISSLNPYIDANGILRVGGRLKHAHLSTDQKHPMILSSSHPLTKLIINKTHSDTLHGGVKLTLNHIRRKFWIIRGTNTVKAIINQCIRCFRFKAKESNQLMGQFPEARVKFSRPFTHCGVDYAGPVNIRCSQTRGVKSHKAYIALFVCMATKAVHIELTSDLTTDGFMAALRRMISRRGSIYHLYSDNGTNFVGAKNIIDALQSTLAENAIQWHFIPPGAPHFGGLWEAGVKSVKYHLNRIIGEQKLTYEEMNTILVQIEGCLNSRPLCPLTDNIEDLDALTPGHFIIGSPLIAPQHDVILDLADSSLKRWKLIQKLKQDICKRWYEDYINKLQQRYKWKQPVKNLEPGQLVLLKNELLTPSKWPLGKIIEVHSGVDNLVRVVTVKTQKGTFKRPVAKVCLLPNEENIMKLDDNMGQPSNPPSNSPRRKLRDRKQSTSFSIALVILSLFSFITSGSTRYTITHPEVGLFIEQIGTAKIQRGVLRTSIRFPIADMLRDQVNMNKTRDQIIELCDKAKSVTKESQCDELRHHMEEEWKNVFSIFNRLEVTPLRRQKRGLLGTILTSIFGVNDEVYHDIEDLDSNQKALIKSSTTNTKIMLSTISSVNETETRINNKINNFTRKLNAGLEEINKMESWYRIVDENKINIHVTNAYLIALSYMREIEIKYNKLLNAYLKRSHLLEFLSHKSMEEIINKCAEKLGPEMEVLPDPMDKLELSSTSTEILVTGYFMISDANEYDLIKANTVPEKIDEQTFREVQLQQSVLGVNYNLQRYFELPLEDINKAPALNETTFILRPSIFHNIEQSEDCIIQQLYKKLSFKRCPTRTVRLTHTMWKELWTHNTWMFITPEETTVFVNCGPTREEVILNDTGIIHITPDCVIQSKFIRLESKLIKDTRIVMHFSKSIATVNTLLSTQVPVYFTNETVIPLNKDIMEVLNFNHHEAVEALNRLHDHNWKTIKKHQYWTIGLGSISAAAIFIICLLAAILKYRNRPTKNSANIELRAQKRPSHRFEINWATTSEEAKC